MDGGASLPPRWIEEARLATRFDYAEAFGRTLGWISEFEQQRLKRARIAIAGMGGVGGAHLLTLARLGIGAFTLADHDRFELANFNRQVGASMATLGEPKVTAMARLARGINPEIDLRLFAAGVDRASIDEFLDGVDLFIDGLDFFAFDIRAAMFARCRELGIPAITAAPVGTGAAYLVFTPEGMSFDDYFRLSEAPVEDRPVRFLLGLAPASLHRRALIDHSRVDLLAGRGPSTPMACELCAAVAATEALKLLCGRGNVYAAPWYHQFDPFSGRFVRRKLRGGNNNPLQRVKLALARRKAASLTRGARPVRVGESGTMIERILDVARWAPSGDNAQPWRFSIDGDGVEVAITVEADNPYEFNQGEPTLMAAGGLLETMRIAASAHQRHAMWRYRGVESGAHRLRVEFPFDASVAVDPLLAYVTTRSVDRRPYRTAKLNEDWRAALQAALGDGLEARWFESPMERLRVARLNAMATDARLRDQGCYQVHRRILDWQQAFSADGVPVTALGLTGLTRTIMRWAMADWRRLDRLNRFAGGTLLARLEMDVLPGLACGAHVVVVDRHGAEGIEAHLERGVRLQRFWLTATRLGLAFQPSFAPVCFAQRDAKIARSLRHLAAGRIAFIGRIGQPRAAAPTARSMRLPLPALIAKF
jgi:sulfur-carrier protein adenylyltransferase/sulfurtransferase